MSKCLNCSLEAYRDVVGVLNMAALHGGGVAIGLVAQPLLLRWDGYGREPRRAVNTQGMNTPEARIPYLRGNVNRKFREVSVEL
ncbi:MAG: hypothetical protein DRJ47_11265 [Thermoprotei archaeon]|nr:MAG: hypothetical protein DRJ47_11265 [Thermoprotei archaeon]